MTPNKQQLILNLRWLYKHAPTKYLGWIMWNGFQDNPIRKEVEG